MICNASIVLYHTPENEIKAVTDLLQQSGVISHTRLIDNGLPGANIGYGAGHNIALRESIAEGATYHLVLNSDIIFDPAALSKMLNYMEAHPDVALLQPRILYADGRLQASCKLLPTPLDVFGRRFLPKGLIAKRNREFELLDSGYNSIMNIPYLSGCFMLLRVEALKDVGLFDERFFMYPEDIDLTRRLHRKYKTLFWPEVTITHDHRQGSYHSLRLLGIHIVNMIRYFNKWGWWRDEERKRINRYTRNNIILH